MHRKPSSLSIPGATTPKRKQLRHPLHQRGRMELQTKHYLQRPKRSTRQNMGNGWIRDIRNINTLLHKLMSKKLTRENIRMQEFFYSENIHYKEIDRENIRMQEFFYSENIHYKEIDRENIRMQEFFYSENIDYKEIDRKYKNARIFYSENIHYKV